MNGTGTSLNFGLQASDFRLPTSNIKKKGNPNRVAFFQMLLNCYPTELKQFNNSTIQQYNNITI